MWIASDALIASLYFAYNKPKHLLFLQNEYHKQCHHSMTIIFLYFRLCFILQCNLFFPWSPGKCWSTLLLLKRNYIYFVLKLIYHPQYCHIEISILIYHPINFDRMKYKMIPYYGESSSNTNHMRWICFLLTHSIANFLLGVNVSSINILYIML